MLRKISLAALFCLSPIALGEQATAGHGCHHSAPAATHYRAPVGHSHAGRGRHVNHHPVPHAACCSVPSSHAPYSYQASYSAHRAYSMPGAYSAAHAYRGDYPSAASSVPRRPLVYDGYVLGAGAGYSSFRPDYGTDAGAYRGIYEAPSGGNPFTGARLDLRID